MVKTVSLLLKNRLQAIVSAVFGKMTKGGKQRSVTKTVLLSLLGIYLFLCVFGFMTLIFSSIAPAMINAGQQWLYFACAALATLLLCLIGSVFTAQSYMFEAKDNELLLSMPIKPSAILLSRMLMLLVLSYIYGVIVIIPSAIAYSFFAAFTPLGLCFFILGALLLPLLATALSCILGWLMALLFSKMRRKNIVTTIIMFVFVGAYMYIYINMQSYLDQIVQYSAQIASAVRRFIPPAYSFGCAVGQTDALQMLFLVLWCVVPAVLVYWLLSKKFIKIATTSKASVKKKYREKKLRQNSVKTALLKKELGYFLSMPAYIFNCAFGTVMVVLFAGVMLFEGEKLIGMLGSVSPNLVLLLPVFWCAAVSLCCSMNDVSAPSISLEGKTLWILKAQPAPVMDIFFAKSLTNLVVSLPGILIAAVISIFVLPVGIWDVLLFILLPSAVCVFCGMLGVCINLLCPRFDWVNETAVLKQSASVILALLSGMVLSAPPFVAAILIVFFSASVSTMAGYLTLVLCVLYFIILSLLLYVFMRFKGRQIFEKL